MNVLTVNAGSTSVKLERYALPDPLPPIAEPPAPAWSASESPELSAATLHEIANEPLDAVMHRFVQMPPGGSAVQLLDRATIAGIRVAGADDRLHDAPALRLVDAIGRAVPGVAQYAVSDSAFHRTMQAPATTYALPYELTGTTLHRVGYHGLSHEYAAHRGCVLAGLDVATARVVVAHLGGGSSLCAIRGGASIDTTMGYTPLEGIPMATRSGSVDPGLMLHLLRAGMSVDDLADALEKRGGLAGISGRSGDMRELLAAAGDARAQLALDVLAWRLRAAFGAMIANLGGADLIVYTGGIGEHVASLRASGLAGGLGLGVAIDGERNAEVTEGLIGTAASPVRVAVVTAREGWQLARAVALDGFRDS